jgi:hypothetical protein
MEPNLLLNFKELKPEMKEVVWSGSLADYSQLKVFGWTVYAHVDNEKLEPRADN